MFNLMPVQPGDKLIRITHECLPTVYVDNDDVPPAVGPVMALAIVDALNSRVQEFHDVIAKEVRND